MSKRDNDFDDLVDGGEQFADADEGSDAGKSPAEGDEGKGAEDDDKTGGADADKQSGEGDENDDDNDDKASKDGAAADKDGEGADADKDAAKDGKTVPKAALDSVKRRLRETNAQLKAIQDRLGAEDAEVARRAIPKEGTPEHATYVARQTQVVQLNDRLNFSEYHARKAHGDDVVSDAFEWANAQMEGPNGETFAKTLFAHADPYDYAVTLHKTAQEAGDGGGAGEKDPDFEAFKAWKASQTGDGKQAAAPPNDGAKAARPTSLAQRSSAAGPKAEDLVVDPFGSEFG